jgi:Protein of unknown function (DUF664)
METVIMGLIRKAARAQAKAAEAEAGLAEAEAKVAQEQAAAIARALHEDEVHRRADLEEVAEEEAEAVPWSRQAAADAGMQAAPDRKEHSSLCADYRREIELARQAAAGRDLDATFFHSHRNAQMSVRWVYLHMIEEYARHNGHADLLRERIDGATGL